jgi:hypothetical protein
MVEYKKTRASQETPDGKYTCGIGHTLKINKCKMSQCSHLKLNGLHIYGKNKGDA